MSVSVPSTPATHPLDRQAGSSLDQGVRDGLIAAGALTAAHLLGNRYSAFYRGFSPLAKGFFVMAGATSIVMISMERNMQRAYDAHRRLFGAPAPPAVPATFHEWMLLNKHKLITGAFAGSAALGGLLCLRDRHLDPAIRVMNMRLFAQGATLTSLFLIVLLTSIKPKDWSKDPHEFKP